MILYAVAKALGRRAVTETSDATSEWSYMF
jgi:hypothetical protein